MENVDVKPIANPWVHTPTSAPYVLPEDRAAVCEWNASLVPGDPRLIELHVLPEPMLGLHDAPVLLLMGNPGSTPGDRLIDRTWLTPANWNALLTPGGTAMYCLDDRAATFPGGRWWREATRGLLAPGRGYADLAAKLLVVQYHGYHSARPSMSRQNLPPQDFAITLVTQAMDRDAAIILGTASRFWLSTVPQLSSYRYLVTKNSPQSKSLSPRNLGDRYSIVTEALNR